MSLAPVTTLNRLGVAGNSGARLPLAGAGCRVRRRTGIRLPRASRQVQIHDVLRARALTRRHRYGSDLPIIHSVNGFRLHQTAVYLERQTQFGDIPRPRKGSAGVFLDPAQPVADGVRVADKHLGRAVH